jgi:hypothetical protein
LAFTLRDGIEYVEWGIRRGLAVDDFAPRFRFSSTRTTISSRKSPNTAPRAASGTRR